MGLLVLPTNLSAEDPPLLKIWTVGGAATHGTAEGLILSGTLGQMSPVGRASNEAARLGSGFWSFAGSTDDPSPVPQLPTPTTRLFQPAPNPFNPQTTLHFTLSQDGPVSLVIYDIRGRKVRTLVHEQRAAGDHDVFWNGKDDFGNSMASGSYFCRMETDAYSKSVKMLLVK